MRYPFSGSPTTSTQRVATLSFRRTFNFSWVVFGRVSAVRANTFLTPPAKSLRRHDSSWRPPWTSGYSKESQKCVQSSASSHWPPHDSVVFCLGSFTSSSFFLSDFFWPLQLRWNSDRRKLKDSSVWHRRHKHTDGYFIVYKLGILEFKFSGFLKVFKIIKQSSLEGLLLNFLECQFDFVGSCYLRGYLI